MRGRQCCSGQRGHRSIAAEGGFAVNRRPALDAKHAQRQLDPVRGDRGLLFSRWTTSLTDARAPATTASAKSTLRRWTLPKVRSARETEGCCQTLRTHTSMRERGKKLRVWSASVRLSRAAGLLFALRCERPCSRLGLARVRVSGEPATPCRQIQAPFAIGGCCWSLYRTPARRTACTACTQWERRDDASMSDAPLAGVSRFQRAPQRSRVREDGGGSWIDWGKEARRFGEGGGKEEGETPGTGRARCSGLVRLLRHGPGTAPLPLPATGLAVCHLSKTARRLVGGRRRVELRHSADCRLNDLTWHAGTTDCSREWDWLELQSQGCGGTPSYRLEHTSRSPSGRAMRVAFPSCSGPRSLQDRNDGRGVENRHGEVMTDVLGLRAASDTSSVRTNFVQCTLTRS
ncbi:hypothetical protein BV20DRAFT_200894 [Pilatotrama ljubarskyi]|nr:hypothetical protein BV20DRAFT_200894 [Pilatotrama ljubarskyi]